MKFALDGCRRFGILKCKKRNSAAIYNKASRKNFKVLEKSEVHIPRQGGHYCACKTDDDDEFHILCLTISVQASHNYRVGLDFGSEVVL